MNTVLKIATLVAYLFTATVVSAQNFNLVGYALDQGNFTYQLTDYTNDWGFGAIWHDQKITLENSFDYRFELNFGERDGDGADGIVFALQQQSTSAGQAGEGMGILMVQPSLFVEFDTWQNFNRNDPAADHASIFRNGVVDHNSANELDGPVNLPNLEDNQFHQVRIKWNATTQTFSVHLDCDPILSYTGDVVNQIFGGNPEVFWGFTSAVGGNKNRHTVRLANAEPPRDTIPNYSICAGEQVQFLNIARGTWSWQEKNGGTSSIIGSTSIGGITVAPDVTTEYIATVVDECDSWTENVIVEVFSNQTPVITPIGMCVDADPVQLEVSTANGFWGGTGITNTITGTFNPAIAGVGSHVVSYTNDNPACPSTGNATITVHPDAEADAGDPVTLCPGATAQLNGSGGASYVWEPSESLNDANIANPTANPASTTIYTITASTINGCTDVDQVTIEVVNELNVQTIDPAPICLGQQAQLSASGGASYLWSPAELLDDPTSPTPNASVNETTEFEVRVSSGGCWAIATSTITVLPIPEVSVADLRICPGEWATFSPIGMASEWQWVVNNELVSNEKNPTFSPQETTLYTLDYFSAEGCQNSTSATIYVNDNPTIDAGPNVEICAGASVELVASGAVSYVWTSPLSAEVDNYTLHVTPESTNTFSVIGTDENGCTGEASVTITVFDALDATITPTGPFCTADAPVQLISQSSGGMWTGEGIIDPVNGLFDPAVSGEGVFTVRYELDGFCPSSDETEIQVIAFPDPTIDQIGPFCDFDVAVGLTAVTQGGTWSLNGEVLNSPIINPALLLPGRQTVKYTFNGGCPTEDVMEFEILPSVFPKLTEIPPICVDAGSVTLQADVTTGTWTGSGVEGTTFDPVKAGPGQHLIRYDIPVVCGFPEDITITVHPVPDPRIASVPIQCIEGDPITLSAASTGGIWSGPGILDKAAGTFRPALAGIGSFHVNYDVTAYGCSARDSVEIEVRQNHIDLGPDTTLCTRAGAGITLNPLGFATYQWSTGSGNPAIEANYDGTFGVTVWDENGCVAKDEMTVIDQCECNVWYPNAFTPNGDGLNESFKVVGVAELGLDFYIMNRWGDMLFHGTSLDDQWNGDVGNKDNEPKDDVYVIKLVCPDKDPEFGKITLVK